MSQWPYVMPTRPPMPMGIPEEWQKANEALQAVKPNSSSSEATCNEAHNSPVNSLNQYPPVNNQAYRWTTPPMYAAYPGYPGYQPNYGFYYNNYPLMVNNNPFYMNSMVPPVDPAPQIPLINLEDNDSVNNEKDSSESKVKYEVNDSISSVSNLSVSSVPSPPPQETCFNRLKTAPGVHAIKFNLPNKNKQNTNFQATRSSVQQNNFQNFKKDSSTTTKEEESTEETNILNQKSVTNMPNAQWPESLKTYVATCFNKCKTKIHKDQVEIILKGKLCRAYTDGTIYTKDWSAEPFPNLYSEKIEENKKNENEIIIRNEGKKSSPATPKNTYYNRNKSYKNHSRSRSHSRSNSRSRSRSPPRRVIHKRKYDNFSDSSDESWDSRKTLSSSVISHFEPRNSKKSNSKGKNKKKKTNKLNFSVEPELVSDDRLLKRAARFEVKNSQKVTSQILSPSNLFIIDDTGAADMDWNSDAVIGTCQDLEKPFLRLTGAVDPTSVRPEEILMRSLQMVKEHWKTKQDYHFACEQLKSIRQDLVVQCVRNKFAVEVYETHARIALEKGDHTEFNQCQSQLKVLYQEVSDGNRLEFTGYHILYSIYTENAIELKNIIAELGPLDKKDEVVSHALKIAKACSNSNYYSFFKLYLSAPKMSSCIIDWFIERIRKAALKAIVKSFRPNLAVSYIQSALAFRESEECLDFLSKANLVFVDSDTVNCKESMANIANI